MWHDGKGVFFALWENFLIPHDKMKIIKQEAEMIKNKGNKEIQERKTIKNDNKERKTMTEEQLMQRKAMLLSLFADPAYVPMKLKELAILLDVA